ncbi:MAG: hypothetical protein FJ291_03360 [Planctomycetes bacterium]|nr:hypothetical protein [Planctomycetota bacterium]
MADTDPVPPIQIDADRYSTDVAANRYVKHPGGVPQPTEHWLVLGPRGAGKTIMLKALCTEWRAAPDLLPVYVELQHWIAKIAGELPLYGHEPLSPRDRAMLDCMSLAVSLALVTNVATVLHPESTTDAQRLFPWHRRTRTFEDWTLEARRRLREALVSGAPFTDEMPPVHVVAGSLGDSVRREAHKTLVLLIDQVDQVPAPVFQPIASLLRRTASYTTIMASRPCPTAPEQAVMPRDVVAGETYQVLSIGRELELDLRESLITAVLQKLPFLGIPGKELASQSRALAALTWPSLRLAIQICQVYEQNILVGKSPTAWHDAIVGVSHRYEDIVKDALRAWCANPSEVLREWRKEALKRVSHGADRIIRATLRLLRRDLFASVDEDVAAFFRVALKHGILFPSANERYVLDQLPESFEVGPLLLVSDTSRLSPNVPEECVQCDVRQTDLKRWIKPSEPRGVRTKRIFISYWMSDPHRETSEAEVAVHLGKRLLDTVTLVQGEIHGSPQFSPKILQKVESCNMVICDLSTGNRNIFVEYGWAVGLNKPVVLVSKVKDSIGTYPGWLTARQFQFYDTEEQRDKLFKSVIRLLNEPADRVDRWIYQPPAIDMAFSPKPTIVTLMGAGPLVQETGRKCADKIREYGVEFEAFALEDHSAVLFEAIKRARRAGTLALLFTGTSDDYLTCLAGGIFTTKDRAYMAHRHFRRQLILFNASALPRAEAIPDLLSSYPRVELPTSLDHLGAKLVAQAKAVKDWVAAGARRKTK